VKATAEIQVIPIGVGVSVREEVMRAHRLIADSDLHVTLHAYGTNVEGEMSTIFEVIERIHEELHGQGTKRIATFVKLGTRTDKEPSLEAKLD
jgi:uncharacterized protein (TIGR00106 family)